MKKKLLRSLTFIVLITVVNSVKAQVFLDENFDTYADGDDVVAVSENWESSFPVPFPGPEVTNTQFVSAPNALRCTNDKFGRVIHPTITEGVILYSLDIFVEEGKEFAFQVGDTTIGTGTIGLFHFKPDGTLYLENITTETVLLSETYTQGEWFEFKIRVNLDLANWECYINGDQIGSDFSYPEMTTFVFWDFQGISPDFDPELPIGAWVDNIFIEAMDEVYVGTDLGIATFKADYGVVGQEKEVKARIRNYGATTITDFEISMNYNDGEVTGTKSYSDLSLESADAFIVEFDETIILENDKSLVCEITSINGVATDDNAENDTSTYDLPFLFTPAENKKIFIEEATGTWCSFCPRARVQIEWLIAYFGEYLEAAAIHNGDPMATEDYDEGDLGVTSFPTLFTDRGPTATMYDFAGAEAGIYEDDLFPFPMDATSFLSRLEMPPSAVINPEFTYDVATRELNVTANYEFSAAIENYKVACVITEDEVSGEGEGWAQKNSYAIGEHTLFDPTGFDWNDAEPTIPASEMVYHHVGRIITPNITGGDVIASATDGETVTREFSITLDEDWNHNHIKIIVLLFDNTGQVDNVESASLAGEFVNITAQEETKLIQASLYPNPAQGLTNLDVQLSVDSETDVIIRSIDGKEITRYTLAKDSGNTLLPIDLNEFAKGTYFIQINQGASSETLKLLHY